MNYKFDEMEMIRVVHRIHAAIVHRIACRLGLGCSNPPTPYRTVVTESLGP